MGWKPWVGVAVVLLALAGWRTFSNKAHFGDAPRTAEDCIERNAQPAATDRLVRLAHDYCQRAAHPSTHPVMRARYACYTDAVPSLRAEQAIYAVYEACDAKHPMPPCGAGQFHADDGSCMTFNPG